MPMDLKKYPKDWKRISQQIRERAGNRCECEGECGLHSKRRCVEVNGRQASYANGKVVLTVAHLWKGPCKPCADRGIKCGEPSHLKAMCQRCHLRYDIEHHMANAAATRRLKKRNLELPL